MFMVDNWSEKACRRRTQGVGRMRYLKNVFRRFRYADCVSLSADDDGLKVNIMWGQKLETNNFWHAHN